MSKKIDILKQLFYGKTFLWEELEMQLGHYSKWVNIIREHVEEAVF